MTLHLEIVTPERLVYSDDVDAVVARVAGLGGRVLLAPTDILTVGRFATIMDPQGAILSLITYSKKN